MEKKIFPSRVWQCALVSLLVVIVSMALPVALEVKDLAVIGMFHGVVLSVVAIIVYFIFNKNWDILKLFSQRVSKECIILFVIPIFVAVIGRCVLYPNRENICNEGIWMFVYSILFAPIGEEILFRGLLLNGLLSRYNKHIAVVAISLLFGLFHSNPTASLLDNMNDMTNAFVCGLCLSYIFSYTKSLLLCIVVHIVVNFMAFLLGGDVMISLMPDYMRYIVGVSLIIVAIILFVVLKRKLQVSFD